MFVNETGSSFSYDAQVTNSIELRANYRLTPILILSFANFKINFFSQHEQNEHALHDHRGHNGQHITLSKPLVKAPLPAYAKFDVSSGTKDGSDGCASALRRMVVFLGTLCV